MTVIDLEGGAAYHRSLSLDYQPVRATTLAKSVPTGSNQYGTSQYPIKCSVGSLIPKHMKRCWFSLSLPCELVFF